MLQYALDLINRRSVDFPVPRGPKKEEAFLFREAQRSGEHSAIMYLHSPYNAIDSARATSDALPNDKSRGLFAHSVLNALRIPVFSLANPTKFL